MSNASVLGIDVMSDSLYSPRMALAQAFINSLANSSLDDMLAPLLGHLQHS